MIQMQSSASILASAALLGGVSAQAAPTTMTMPALYVSDFAQNFQNQRFLCAEWAERQFSDLARLSGRWDEFGIDPIQSKTIFQLRALLSSARNSGEHTGHIVPGADGSLQAEWHLEDMIVGALVEDDGTYSAWVHFIDNGSQSEEFGWRAVDFLRSLAITFRLNV